jgi:hypothetical protein
MPLPRALIALALFAASVLPAAAYDTACFLEIRDALTRATASGPVRIVMSVDDATGLTTTTELIPGTALRQVINMAGAEGETVAIGDRAWIRLEGSWSEAGGSHAKLLMMTSTTAALTLIAGLTEADCSGEEPIGGTGYRTLSFVSGIGTDATTTMRLDGEGRPVHIDIGAGRIGTSSRTTITYAYDTSIVINPPVP